MAYALYRYAVVVPRPVDPKFGIPLSPGDLPPICFGFFMTLSAATAHMRYLGGRLPSVSVWDRSKFEYAAHLWQESEAVVFDPIWPLLDMLMLQPDGSYWEVKCAQNHDGTFTQKD